MKVYVAERGYDHEGTTILGVFSTKEKADEVCTNDVHSTSPNGERKSRGDFHQVTDFILDEPTVGW